VSDKAPKKDAPACPRCAEKDRYIEELEEEFGVNTSEQRHLRLNRALRKAGVRGPADWRKDEQQQDPT
jgi:hypothetical protein